MHQYLDRLASRLGLNRRSSCELRDMAERGMTLRQLTGCLMQMQSGILLLHAVYMAQQASVTRSQVFSFCTG